MSEYKKISKEAAKVIKHLLNVASTDCARPALMAIRVDIENDYAGSADGFRLTFVKYTNSPLEGIFTESGVYQVSMGKFNREYVVEIEKMENLTYPNLRTIIHAKDNQPSFIFSMDKNLLAKLLAESANMVTFKVWTKVEPVEFIHKIAGVDTYSVQMPMHTPDEVKSWKPEYCIPKETKDEN